MSDAMSEASEADEWELGGGVGRGRGQKEQPEQACGGRTGRSPPQPLLAGGAGGWVGRTYSLVPCYPEIPGWPGGCSGKSIEQRVRSLWGELRRSRVSAGLSPGRQHLIPRCAGSGATRPWDPFAGSVLEADVWGTRCPCLPWVRPRAQKGPLPQP